MPAKTHVYLVTTANGDTTGARLIRGTIRQVEAQLRSELSIEVCTAEKAHSLAGTKIEDATEQ